MGVDADVDVCAFGGIDEMAVCDGLPGVVPGEDAADDEAFGVEAADVRMAGGVTDYEWQVLPGFEVGLQALPDLCDGEFCREGIPFVKEIFHRMSLAGAEAFGDGVGCSAFASDLG